jgi:transmembrane sensor
MNDPDCTEAERLAFQLWMAENEAHRTEYQQFELLWQTLDSLPKKRTRLRQSVYTVCAVIGMLALLMTMAPPTGQQLIATAIGERRHLVLPDGSEIDVNANSRIRTDYSWFSRRIEVETGEVVLRVAKDKFRPFEVQAGIGLLRDIGTTFDVAKNEEHVTVGVIDGAVEVRLEGYAGLARLEGGEQFAYSNAGGSLVTPLDREVVGDWTRGRMVFKDTPLNEVVAGMNRQHARPMVVNDTALAQLRVSGVFNIEDRAGLIKALETLYSLQAHEAGGATVLARAKTPP